MEGGVDRRRHPRQHLTARCKIFHRASNAYVVGVTSDLSPGGVRVRVADARPWREGEAVDVALAWGRQAIVPAEQVRAGLVVRALAIDGAQHVAIAFVEAMPLALAAAA